MPCSDALSVGLLLFISWRSREVSTSLCPRSSRGDTFQETWRIILASRLYCLVLQPDVSRSHTPALNENPNERITPGVDVFPVVVHFAVELTTTRRVLCVSAVMSHEASDRKGRTKAFQLKPCKIYQYPPAQLFANFFCSPLAQLPAFVVGCRSNSDRRAAELFLQCGCDHATLIHLHAALHSADTSARSSHTFTSSAAPTQGFGSFQ